MFKKYFKFLKKFSEAEIEDLLKKSIAKLSSVENWDAESLQNKLNELLTETEKKPIPRFEPKNENETDVKADAKTEPKPQPKEQAVQELPKREESADAKTKATAEEKPKRDIKVIRSIYDRQRDGAASVKLVDSGKTEVKVVKLVNKDGITLEDKLRKENEEKELEKIAEKLGIPASFEEDAKASTVAVKKHQTDNKPAVYTGSLYYIGELLKEFK